MASDFDASRSLAPIGLCVLALIAGAWTAHLEVFPYESLMEPPFRAARAYIERALVEPPATSQHWTLREGEPRGVSRPAPGRSWGEYTVYTSYGAPAVYMIDHCGAVAHVWHAPFRSVWPEPSHIRRPVPDSQIRIGAFDVTAGGEITATFKAEGDTPYGYGVARLDADSDVLWRAPVRGHHDVDVLEDGSVLTLAHRWRTLSRDPAGRFASDSGRILEDFVVRLSATGEVLGRYSLVDALVESPARRVVVPWFQRHESWDALHANGVAMIGEDFAEHHAFAEAGQVLVSMRSLYAIGLLDLQEKRFTWLARGGWVAQHDPDPLPNGRIMLFDNGGHPGPEGVSRILEFDPGSKRVTWSFPGTDAHPLVSGGHGGQTQLPNGNVLIAESAEGRLIEVTREGRVVWSYDHPVRAGSTGAILGPQIAGTVERFAADELTFTPRRPPTRCDSAESNAHPTPARAPLDAGVPPDASRRGRADGTKIAD